MRDRELPGRRARGAGGAGTRRRADRSQLHAGHDLGPGRPGPPGEDPGDRSDAAGDRDDRLGHGRPRRRGDAARRPGLRPEAVGQRAAADDAPHADRSRAGAARGPAPRGREPDPPPRGRRSRDRRLAGDAAGARRHRPRRAVGRQRADHGRQRHRQVARRALAPRGLRPRVPAVPDAQRRRHLRGRLRERALRPRQGRLHRRPRGPRRPLRARRRRDAVPGRDRQRSAVPAGQAAPRPRDGRVRACRLLEDPPLRRPDPLGDQREPARRSRGRAVPAGPAFPPEHDRDPRAVAAPSGGRTSRCSPGSSCRATPSDTARRSRASSPRRWKRCSRIPGRATCASSTTRSSAPCSCPPAVRSGPATWA